MYKIIISSYGNGWSDEQACEGEVTFSGGAVAINYTLDGDNCMLTVDGGKVIQRRIGAQNVNIQFEEGKKTDCTFGSGGLSGSFEVLTKKIKFISGKSGLKLYLEYLSGNDREQINLTFTALNDTRGIK